MNTHIKEQAQISKPAYLVIAVGNEQEPYGRTILNIHEDGRILVYNDTLGQTINFQSQLKDGRWIIEQMNVILGRFKEETEQRAGIPGEAIYEFGTNISGVHQKYDIWHSEITKHLEFKALLSLLANWTRQLSDGKVIL
jgi:hypothetical protein